MVEFLFLSVSRPRTTQRLDKKDLLHEPKSKGMNVCIPQMGNWMMNTLLLGSVDDCTLGIIN